jgi:hypothetical protein
MKRIIMFITLGACALGFHVLQAQPALITSGQNHPESAIVHNGFIYITNIGKALAPTEKDGDGAIAKLDRSGKVVDVAFNKSPLNAPKGTAIVKNTLYVADIDRIVGFDLSSGKQTDVIDLSGEHVNFLNDLAPKGDSVLFVTTTDQNKIFSVSLGKPHHVKPVDVPAITGANGLEYDARSNTLYVCGMEFNDAPKGEIGKITWTAGRPRYTRITDLTGLFDGLVLLDDHTLVVSDWISMKVFSARLISIDLRNDTYKVLTEKTDAADIAYDKASKRFILPGLRDGNVLEYKIK